METVTANSNTYALLPDEFWHLIAEGSHLPHNILVGKGVCGSTSVLARQPGLEAVSTMYGFQAQQDTKEQLWEGARLAEDENLPTRIGSFFLFESEQLANAANDNWYSKNKRQLVKARIVMPSRLHRADTVWLDCNDSDEATWRTNAEKYWRGEMTENPFPEVIVDGALYFPDWKTIGKLFGT